MLMSNLRSRTKTRRRRRLRSRRLPSDSSKVAGMKQVLAG